MIDALESACVDSISPSLSAKRANWPRGFFGSIAYIYDHKIRGFSRPIDWNSLHMLELAGGGFPIFANGGILVLLGGEVHIFKLVITDWSNEDIALKLNIESSHIKKVRDAIAYRLGASTQTEFAQLALVYKNSFVSRD